MVSSQGKPSDKTPTGEAVSKPLERRKKGVLLMEYELLILITVLLLVVAIKK
jgi:hypothetical protein